MTFNTFQPVRPLVATLLAALTLAGCDSMKSDQPDFAQESDIDSAFAAGAGRAPTARTLHQLAVLLAAQGKDAEAHHVLVRLIDTYPDFPPAYAELAAIHMRHDRHDEARTALDTGLALKPNDPVLLNNMGMCYMVDENYGEALTYFDKAAAITPHNARYQANRALAMGLKGDYDASLAAYKTILPEAEAHYNLAVIAEARDDDARAAEEYAQAQLLGFKDDDDKKEHD